jgi:D-amino-acid dehydrogenase
MRLADRRKGTRGDFMNARIPAEIVIVGGGLLGWSTAYRLAKSGRAVTVIDRDEPGAATLAGAGIIAPASSLSVGETYLTLAKVAVDYYHRLIPELAEDGETDTGYATPGLLFVARDEDEFARLPAARDLVAARKAAGIGNAGEIELIDGAAAKERFPALADLPGAVWLSGAARVNGRRLRAALQRAAERHGAEVLLGDARLVREGDRITAVQVGAQRLAPEIVVIAGGAWSNALGEAIGVSIPLYPQRGQIVHLDLPGVKTGDWPIISGFYTQYILTFPDNRVVAGATREHDSGYELRLTAGGIQSVLNEALRVAPGLENATIAEIRIGLRPFSPDGLPMLGNVSTLANVVLNTGHGPFGLTLGPVSGALIAGLVNGETPDIDLSPFRVERFAQEQPTEAV